MKIRKYFVICLVIFGVTLSMPAFALTIDSSENKAEEDVNVSMFEIEEFKEMLEESPIISNIYVMGDTITYTINNSIPASISIKKEKDIVTYIVNEDGKEDLIQINLSENKLYMNNDEISITIRNEYSAKNVQPLGTTFVYYGTKEYNVSLTTRVRYATLSSILVAMKALIAPTSVDLPTIAALCIQVAEAGKSNSNDIIVNRITYMHVDYIAYKYYDTYKIDGKTVTTDEFEYWQ